VTLQMNELVKLTSLKEGDWGIIHSIEGGSAVTGRLAGMGIFPNARFRLTQISGGLIVIEVTDTKIALGQGEASKILVKKWPRRKKSVFRRLKRKSLWHWPVNPTSANPPSLIF